MSFSSLDIKNYTQYCHHVGEATLLDGQDSGEETLSLTVFSFCHVGGWLAVLGFRLGSSHHLPGGRHERPRLVQVQRRHGVVPAPL